MTYQQLQDVDLKLQPHNIVYLFKAASILNQVAVVSSAIVYWCWNIWLETLDPRQNSEQEQGFRFQYCIDGTVLFSLWSSLLYGLYYINLISEFSLPGCLRRVWMLHYQMRNVPTSCRLWCSSWHGLRYSSQKNLDIFETEGFVIRLDDGSEHIVIGGGSPK